MNSDTTDQDRGLAAFEARSREFLRARADQPLPGRVQSRLTAARSAALAELREQGSAPRFRIPGVWLPLGSVAAAAVLGVAVWLSQPAGAPATVAVEANPVEDAEMLSSKDGPEMLADDADFYEWAGNQSSGAGAG